MIIVYGIPNCDTVKKARLWLANNGQDYQFHDFKKHGVPAENLTRWMSALGWEKVINRQGTSWRKLDADAQAGAVDAQSASALVLAQPSLIKRPVVEWPDASLSIGFDAQAWAQRCGITL